MQTAKTASRDRLELVERTLLGFALAATTAWATLGDAVAAVL
jgi:hypothetical protein